MKTPKSKPSGSLTRLVGLRPRDCECLADICSLDTSHKSVGRFDMMLQHDQALVLTEHVGGQPQKAAITIPKRVFLQMLEWYDTEQPNDKLRHAAENS